MTESPKYDYNNRIGDFIIPGKFVNKKDATMAGHADKWSHGNRRSNSHNAGEGGEHSSRNQGTGLQGKLNTMPSQGIDTSRMNPDEKLKYFKSLGLMPGREPTPEPSIKDLPNVLRAMFKDEPTYIKDITTALKAVPPAQYQAAVKAVFHAAHNTESDDVYDKYEAIMNAIQSV